MRKLQGHVVTDVLNLKDLQKKCQIFYNDQAGGRWRRRSSGRFFYANAGAEPS